MGDSESEHPALSENRSNSEEELSEKECGAVQPSEPALAGMALEPIPTAHDSLQNYDPARRSGESFFSATEFQSLCAVYQGRGERLLPGSDNPHNDGPDDNDQFYTTFDERYSYDSVLGRTDAAQRLPPYRYSSEINVRRGELQSFRGIYREQGESLLPGSDNLDNSVGHYNHEGARLPVDNSGADSNHQPATWSNAEASAWRDFVNQARVNRCRNGHILLFRGGSVAPFMNTPVESRNAEEDDGSHSEEAQ